MASIDIPGFASNDPRPGVYLWIAFAMGAASGSGGVRRAVMLANKLASASATADTVIYGPDTPVPCQTEADVITLAGAGSPAHRMFRRWAKKNKTTPLYFVFVAPSAGTAATGTIVLTTNAAATGNLRIWVHDEFVDVTLLTGMTPTQIAVAAVAAVNAKTHWGVTASNTAGTLTLTAKVPGPRGNDIRYMAAISGAGVATTTSATTDTALSSGATQDSNTNALATLLAKSFYYVISEANDATQLGAAAAQIGSQSMPMNDIRGRLFAGSALSVSSANSLATGINNPRLELPSIYKSVRTPAELAAECAAVYALGELNENNPRTNYCGYGNDAETQATWDFPAPRDVSAHPSSADILSMLNSGVTPIAVNPNGSTYIVDRITTRSLSGATPDYRIRDAHKVTICDFLGETIQTKTRLQYAGKRIGDNPRRGQRVPGPMVVTPDGWKKDIIFPVINRFDENDLLQNADVSKAGCITQRETNPPTRMNALLEIQTIDNAKQFGIAVHQTA